MDQGIVDYVVGLAGRCDSEIDTIYGFSDGVFGRAAAVVAIGHHEEVYIAESPFMGPERR